MSNPDFWKSHQSQFTLVGILERDRNSSHSSHSSLKNKNLTLPGLAQWVHLLKLFIIFAKILKDYHLFLRSWQAVAEKGRHWFSEC